MSFEFEYEEIHSLYTQNNLVPANVATLGKVKFVRFPPYKKFSLLILGLFWGQVEIWFGNLNTLVVGNLTISPQTLPFIR